METFYEWVGKNHPEDEVLNEFLRDLARKGAGAAALAGALAVGSGAGEAKGAMPMAPQVSKEEGHSDKEFNRELALATAKDMGMSQGKIAQLSVMDDFELWHWQMREINKIEREMSRHKMALMRGAMGVGVKEWPMWYIKFGHHYGWKAPKPPESVGEVGK